MTLTMVIKGAIGGLLAAAAVDAHAWQSSSGKDFDWKLASRRWLAGAVIGAATAYEAGS